MKITMIILCLTLVSWGANAQMDHTKMGHSENGNSKVESKIKETATVTSSIKVEHSLSVTAIIDNYLDLKNALVDDNSLIFKNLHVNVYNININNLIY